MIELVIESRSRDLGGFQVGRVLPFSQKRMVGPFIFFDHFGPVRFEAGHPAQRRRAAASAHRAVDGFVPVRRRDHASRQRGLRAADPAGRAQLDDGGSRNHPLRAFRASTCGGRHDARHPGMGRAAPRARGNRALVLASRRGGPAHVREWRVVGAAHRRQRVRRACARQDPLADVLRPLATAAGGEGAIAGRVSGTRGIRRRRAPSTSAGSRSRPAR